MVSKIVSVSAADEAERLRVLRDYAILDTPAEAAFDELTELAALICEAPIALITLLDEHRQWFKSRVGISVSETSRDLAFCTHTIRQPDLFVVADALIDQRFATNPLVLGDPHIRFYAGAPLVSSEGHALGSLCVIDRVPRQLSANHQLALRVLSHHVVSQLELRRNIAALQRAEADLQRSHDELEKRVLARTAELTLAREEAENARREVQLAIKAAGIGLWSWEVAEGRLNLSPEWRAQLGFREDELGDAVEVWESRLHPDDRERAVTGLRNCLSHPRGTCEMEFRLQHKDGSYRWFLSRTDLHFESSGKPARMLGCQIDITAHRATEEGLLRSRAQLRALSAHLQSVREEEAKRIARELHDELGAALTGLKMDVSWMARQLSQPASNQKTSELRDRMQGAVQLVDGTIESVRRICLELRPAVLDQLGLAAALAWQASDFQSHTGILCRIERPEEVSVTPERATALFRIFQEVLTNITRHARATEVQVALCEDEKDLVLEIRDNGCGFAKEETSPKSRFGLVGMRERALAVGGKVHVTSAPDEGTTVDARVPRTLPS